MPPAVFSPTNYSGNTTDWASTTLEKMPHHRSGHTCFAWDARTSVAMSRGGTAAGVCTDSGSTSNKESGASVSEEVRPRQALVGFGSVSLCNLCPHIRRTIYCPCDRSSVFCCSRLRSQEGLAHGSCRLLIGRLSRSRGNLWGAFFKAVPCFF